MSKELMSINRWNRQWMAALVVCSIAVSQASANLFINEIFFDPGGGGVEQRDEFIELRGTPGMSLNDHYLIFIESEDNATNTGNAGIIDNIFDLSGVSMGSNGFLTIRQSGNNSGSGSSLYPVVPGTTDLINTGSGPGYGSGAGSSIGASDIGDEGVIENGAFTAFIIRNDSGSAPVLGTDLDVGNDGLDNPNGQAGWSIIDGISIFEPGEAVLGRAYAQIAFGDEAIGDPFFLEGQIRITDPGLEPGAQYVSVDYEIEYLARWGNSVGQTEADWHVSNLTDNVGSGSMSVPLDFRQAGDPHPASDGNPNTPAPQPAFVESNRGVPYGTKLLTNIGGPNYMTGDFNGDGVVNAIDFTVWRNTEGVGVGTEANHPAADPNHDFDVDIDDYNLWAANYGEPEGGIPTASFSEGVSTPEPTSALLALIAGAGLMAAGRRS